MNRSAPGSRSSGLQLPRSRQTQPSSRRLFRGRGRPRPPRRTPLQLLRLLLSGLLLLALGGGLALLVATLPLWATGAQQLRSAGGQLLVGVQALGLGLIQLGGLLAVLLLGLLAVLLILAGAMRLIRIVLPVRRRLRRP